MGRGVVRPRVLLVSYYFPPLGGVGAFRAVKLARYLPRFGFEPHVLTLHPPYYYCIDPTLGSEVPESLQVTRTESADPFRIFGRFRPPGTAAVTDGTARDPVFGRITRFAKGLNTWLFLPDNKVGWLPFARRAGIRLVRSGEVDLVYTINVPQTCHLVGRAIHRATGVPWVADFRDAWCDNPDLPSPTSWHRAWNRALERSVLREASVVVAVNDTIRRLLVRASGGREENSFHTIHNGYDREDFEALPAKETDRFTMVFVGTFHRRTDPRLLLRPFRECLRSGAIPAGASRIVVVGGQSERTREAVRELGLEEEVLFTGFLSHSESLSWMASAHLLLQVIASGPGSDQIVSGKLYEYMAAGRPILSIGPEGEARALTRSLRLGDTADVEDEKGVAAALAEAYRAHRSGGIPYDPDREGVSSLAFGEQTRKLALLLQDLLPSDPSARK